MTDETNSPHEHLQSLVRELSAAAGLRHDEIPLALVMGMAIGIKDNPHYAKLSLTMCVDSALQGLESMGLAGMYSQLIRAGIAAGLTAPPADGETANVVNLFSAVIAKASNDPQRPDAAAA